MRRILLCTFVALGLAVTAAAGDFITGGASTDKIAGKPLPLGTDARTVVRAADLNDIKRHTEGWVSVKSYGAHSIDEPGFSTFDSTAAIQAAIDAMGGTGTVFIPQGQYKVTSSLTTTNAIGLRIVGSGLWASRLRWYGAAGTSVLIITNGFRCTVADLSIDQGGANAPGALIESRQDSTVPGYVYGSSQNTYRDLRLPGGTHAIKWTIGGGPDQLNDLSRIERVVASDQTVANFSIYGQNSLGHQFWGCYLFNAPRGVLVENVTAGLGGSFQWFGGYVTSTAINFDLQGVSPKGAQIYGCDSEQTPRFLQAASQTVGNPITISGVRYSGSRLNADGYAVYIQSTGPHHIVGNTWGHDAGGTAWSGATTYALNDVVYLSGQYYHSLQAGNLNHAPAGVTDAWWAITTPKLYIAQGGGGVASVKIEENNFDAGGAAAMSSILTANALVQYSVRRNTYKNTAGLRTTKPAQESGGTLSTFTYVGNAGGSSYTPDVGVAADFKIVINDTNPWTLAAPINASSGQVITVQIKATAALNTNTPFPQGNGWRSQWDVTPGAGAWTPPGSGKGYVFMFRYDGTSWFQIGAATAVLN